MIEVPDLIVRRYGVPLSIKVLVSGPSRFGICTFGGLSNPSERQFKLAGDLSHGENRLPRLRATDSGDLPCNTRILSRSFSSLLQDKG